MCQQNMQGGGRNVLGQSVPGAKHPGDETSSEWAKHPGSDTTCYHHSEHKPKIR